MEKTFLEVGKKEKKRVKRANLSCGLGMAEETGLVTIWHKCRGHRWRVAGRKKSLGILLCMGLFNMPFGVSSRDYINGLCYLSNV